MSDLLGHASMGQLRSCQIDSPKNVLGGAMLSNALKALGSKEKQAKQQGRPTKHIFPATRLGHLVANSNASDTDLSEGIGSSSAGAVPRFFDSFGRREIARLQGVLEAALGLEIRPAGTEQDTDEYSEIVLDATSRALVAQLAELPEDRGWAHAHLFTMSFCFR